MFSFRCVDALADGLDGGVDKGAAGRCGVLFAGDLGGAVVGFLGFVSFISPLRWRYKKLYIPQS